MRHAARRRRALPRTFASDAAVMNDFCQELASLRDTPYEPRPEPAMGDHPNIDDMEAHLRLLYDWTQTYYPHGCFEVRCINPKDRCDRSPNERFSCSPEGYQRAVEYAVRHNDRGYNTYVTVNPIKPGTDHPATDDDVEIAIHQFADADEVENADRLAVEGSQGFKPTFSTLTGTVPKPRHHIYWRRDEPVTDMAAWRMTQAAVAQYLGTDQTVKNPSRVDRLAGSISYPPPHKQERGYVTELTSLNITDNGEVCGESFAASFPYTEPEVKMPPPVTRNPQADTSGSVPIYVIKAAFDAIPTLMGKGHYNAWLDISMCAKAANSSCFPEFDEWQRRSDRYDPKKDSLGWPLSKKPRQGSYLGLFAHAKNGDEQWWAHDADVYEWWCQEQAKRAAHEHPAFSDDEPGNTTVDQSVNATVHGDSQKQKRRYEPEDLFPILSERELMDQPQMTFLIEDFIPEDSVVVVWGELAGLQELFVDRYAGVHGAWLFVAWPQDQEVRGRLHRGRRRSRCRQAVTRLEAATQSRPHRGTVLRHSHGRQHFGARRGREADLAVASDGTSSRHQVRGGHHRHPGEVHGRRR